MLNLDRLASAHKRFAGNHDAMVRGEVEDARAFALNYVKAHPVFRPRSGKLQAATKARATVTKSRARVVVSNGLKYARAIDLGARPHVIRTRRRKALRFMWRGKLVFRARVNHPGNKPYRFLWRANHAAGRVLVQGLSAGMARIASQF